MSTSHGQKRDVDRQTYGLSLIAGGVVFFTVAFGLMQAPETFVGLETYAGQWVALSLVAGVVSLGAGFLSVLFV